MVKTIIPGAIGHGMPMRDAAEGAARAGFQGIWLGSADLLRPAEESEAALRSAEIRAMGFDLPVRFRGAPDEFREDLSNLPGIADRAAALGANRCATWIAPASDQLAYRENFAFHAERLSAICDVLDARGILFGIEFVGTPKARRGARYEFVHRLDQALELCAAVGEARCGLLMDLWHWDLAGQTEADFAQLSADRIALVHLNDAPAGTDFTECGDSPRELPGATGVLRAEAFMRGLRSLGYGGPVAAEPFDRSLGELSYERALAAVSESLDRLLSMA